MCKYSRWWYNIFMDIRKEFDTVITNFEELRQSAEKLEQIAKICSNAVKNGNKIIFCGNGGSAADAQHLAAELVVKYRKIRKAIPAIAITTDTSILTAIGNDIGAECIFERQIEAVANKDDILIGLTTSGNSENVIKAFKKAKEIGLKTVVLTGKTGGRIKDLADTVLCVPSDITNNIQEMHIVCGHIICGLIEEMLT